jgi:hypothetical protein
LPDETPGPMGVFVGATITVPGPADGRHQPRYSWHIRRPSSASRRRRNSPPRTRSSSAPADWERRRRSFWLPPAWAR